MKIRVYRIRLVSTGAVRFRTFPGVALRGALGRALYDSVCTHRDRAECRGCPAEAGCSYPYLFRPSSDALGLALKRYRNLPPPITLRPRFPTGTYGRHSRLTVGLTLVGDAYRCVPHLFAALQDLGRRGVGANRRESDTAGSFRLETIETVGPTDTVELLTPVGALRPLDTPWAVPEHFESARGSERWRVAGRFCVDPKSPTLISRKGEARGTLAFPALIKAALRRFSLLSQAFCGGPVFQRAEELAMVEAAESVEIERADVAWLEVPRRSSRTGSRMVFGGWRGHVVYRGDPTPFLPLLRAARYVHVGKRTAFGWGEIVLRPASWREP